VHLRESVLSESIIFRTFHGFARRIRGTITSVSTSDPVVAITFDDGPDPEVMPRLLSILKRHEARGTFFMLGESARKYPELVKEVASAGHAIGNHSWDHPSFPAISRQERRRQLKACDQAISPHGIRLFRPPFGHQNRETFLDAFLLGHQVVTWSVDSEDWLCHDGHLIADRIERQTTPGSILVFHDAMGIVLDVRYRSRERTLDAVDMVLDRLGGRFRFVTVPELLRHGHPRRVEWGSLGSADLFSRIREPDGTPWRYRPAGEGADRFMEMDGKGG
jgi:peptidoglycan/xylan/chitin deacetylase (PgdA/CDA1 family)